MKNQCLFPVWSTYNEIYNTNPEDYVLLRYLYKLFFQIILLLLPVYPVPLLFFFFFSIFFSHPDFVLYSTIAMKAAFLHLSFLFLFLNSSPYGPDTSYSVWSSQGLLGLSNVHGICKVFLLQWLICCRAQALGHAGFSRWGSQSLEHRLSSRGI